MPDVLGVRIVPPRDRKQIRAFTKQLREVLGCGDDPYFPVIHVIEWVLPNIDEEFSLEVLEDKDLIGRSAETIPDQHKIRVKQSVYDAVCKGHIWARQIMAHELGHYCLHSSAAVAYASPIMGETIPKRFLPEYQADVFAAELLAPVEMVDGLSPKYIQQKFGVPYGMAESQLRQASELKQHKKKKRSSK